jgi:hypothetical protein
LEFIIAFLFGILVGTELFEEGFVTAGSTGGGAKGLCLSIVNDGFFVVGDAIGGGEDGRFDEGETHDYNLEW